MECSDDIITKTAIDQHKTGDICRHGPRAAPEQLEPQDWTCLKLYISKAMTDPRHNPANRSYSPPTSRFEAPKHMPLLQSITYHV